MRKVMPKRAETWNCYNGRVAQGVYEVQRDSALAAWESDEAAARAHFSHVLDFRWPGRSGVIAWGPKTREARAECAAHEAQMFHPFYGDWVPGPRQVGEALLGAVIAYLYDEEHEGTLDKRLPEELREPIKFIRKHVPEMALLLACPDALARE